MAKYSVNHLIGPFKMICRSSMRVHKSKQMVLHFKFENVKIPLKELHRHEKSTML